MVSSFVSRCADIHVSLADMAEYTGAQERIALGKKSRKVEERKRRAGMVEMIEDACVAFVQGIKLLTESCYRQEEQDDEEAREWEMAQVRRAADADRDMAIQQRTKPKDVHVAAPSTHLYIRAFISSLTLHIHSSATSPNTYPSACNHCVRQVRTCANNLPRREFNQPVQTRRRAPIVADARDRLAQNGIGRRSETKLVRRVS